MFVRDARNLVGVKNRVRHLVGRTESLPVDILAVVDQRTSACDRMLDKQARDV